MSVDSRSERNVEVSLWTWFWLLLGLRRRGGGRRESGAFLLGQWTGPAGRVKRVAFYDDLDPRAYQNGIIVFHGEGQAALWKICRETGFGVVADCHTHGNADTRQSLTDQRHPMIPEVGHTALIFPHFARLAPWSRRGVGVHEYLGNYTWRQHDRDGRSGRLRITLF